MNKPDAAICRTARALVEQNAYLTRFDQKRTSFKNLVRKRNLCPILSGNTFVARYLQDFCQISIICKNLARRCKNLARSVIFLN